MITDIYSDFNVRTRVGFTGSTGRVSGATFIMVNSSPIKCKKELYENSASETCFTSLAVLNVHSEGMVRAPFKYNDNKKGNKVPSKPLTAMGASGSMQFWTYQRKGTDKGDRFDDITWDLKVGDTLKWFFRVEDVDKSLPTGIDEIPAFSLLEVSMIPKSSDPCVEGWGLNIRSVRVSSLSLYSYINHTSVFSTTREDAKIKSLEGADKQQPIRRQLDCDNPFFVLQHISNNAYTEYIPDNDMVKIWNYRSDSPYTSIDINSSMALKYTNTTHIEEAMRLLEVAIVADACKIFVCSSEFRAKKPGNSECFGVPFIDTQKLFACITPENVNSLQEDQTDDKVMFTLAENVSQFSSVPQTLCIRVSEPKGGKDRENLTKNQTKDLVFTSDFSTCSTAYPIEFCLAETGTVMSAGFFNTSPVEMECGAITLCPQRRKWESI